MNIMAKEDFYEKLQKLIVVKEIKKRDLNQQLGTRTGKERLYRQHRQNNTYFKHNIQHKYAFENTN